MEIKVVKQIMEWNENCHKELQDELKEKKVFMINIMGSPGAGKTTFILGLIDELKKSGIKVGVIEGDIAGKIDAEKMAERGIPVVQLNTDGACHIEAMSIKNILPQFDLDHLDIIIIENIGNLVCPAEFDIGESLKVALLSIPEGDDKVEKYPLMFTRADALVLTKYDLINYFEFNEERVDKNALIRNDELKLFKVNSKNEDDIKEFKNWLISKIEE
ncbi:hydrogenase nickel incorporation protein HypB [Clostridium paraputrificum]|uniref:hydrogenase nickel incorporation protein HypB n=1 Tax=Clostridium TaxID=1485 RepID=UPI000C0839EE|nr:MULTISPECIES: hydrogenase nickel incorporation protein HypB [Clostridium]MDB2088679.1 hydrogenase nickel incorporation protein HypB [Clostridium paraputrificum]MDB2095120.1 hydrogenase nickel incorporation protein HypB [Clostridium paraputrificum]MDU1178634.1 hydrogenase nickel incorporation protein HypB [Clostridium sp.]MDU1225714.1 hydrogenase nickel incorporation protein HypB [Clostridium sp.]MDU1311003.1 hydrogenase nickel incorporation protein HypB [Clostridium sp.]